MNDGTLTDVEMTDFTEESKFEEELHFKASVSKQDLDDGISRASTGATSQQPELTSAAKMQSKHQLLKAGVDAHLFNEIELMADLDHPFILQLNSVAQD